MPPKPTRTPERIEYLELQGGYYLEKFSNSYQLCRKDENGESVYIHDELGMYPKEAKAFAAAMQSPAGEWRDISTCPKNIEVLVYVPHAIEANQRFLDGQIIIAKLYIAEGNYDWQSKEPSWICDPVESESGYYDEVYHSHASIAPTHWLPLPPAPTGEGK